MTDSNQPWYRWLHWQLMIAIAAGRLVIFLVLQAIGLRGT